MVNVSSPNTPGLRELQDKEPLTQLLIALKKENTALASSKETAEKPILLKIAPDLNESQLLDIIAIIQSSEIDGVIATNTTISREGLRTAQTRVQDIGNGGLSGKPVQARSTEVIRYLYQKSNGQLKIIGVGGINGPAAAKEKLEAGACLIQVYSSMVYEGPTLVRDILKQL